MARRRINLRFVTILLAVLVGIAGMGVVASRLLMREHPQQYIDAGQQAMSDGRYGDAAVDYQKASRLSPRDASLLVSYGAALDKLAQNAPDLYGDERKAYEDALTIDPNYLPAIKAMVDLYTHASASGLSAESFRNLIDYARRAHTLDPSDEHYAILPDQTIVQMWVAGLSTDQSEVDAALKELTSLQDKYPGNADVTFSIVLAKLFQAQTLTQQSVGNLQPQDATDLYQQCLQIFHGYLGAPGGPPGPQSDNAMMHARYSQVLQRLSVVDQSPDAPRDQYAKLALDEALKAHDLAKPTDANYLEVNLYAAQTAANHGDMDEAVKIYRAMPDTPTVRINLADLLGRDPKTRSQGEQLLQEVLSQAVDETGHMAGMRLAMTLSLTGLEISDYAEATNPNTRERLRAHIEDELTKLNTSVSAKNTIDIARLQARFLSAEGRWNDVIDNLTSLTSADPNAGHDYRILMMLAGAYANTHQGPRALSTLNQIVGEFPQDVAARKALVRMMIQENPTDAPAQLALLEKMAPKDPDLNLMHVGLLLQDPKNKQDPQVKHYYDLLEEKTPSQIQDKALIAQRMEDWPEATRLLKLLTQQNPKDESNWERLAGLLMYLGKKNDALAAAQKGLAENPDSDELKILVPRIQGADQKLIANLREDLAKKNPDKLQGELDLAEISSERADLDGEEAHLKAAEALAPDSARVWDMLFSFYLKTTRLKDAAVYVDKLSAANYDQCNGAMYQFSLAMARHNYTDAADVARKLTQDKPEMVRSWIALGDVLQAQGQYEQAISEYAIALQKQSTNHAAYAGLVQCSYLLKRPQDALEYLQDGLTRMPDDSRLRDMLIDHELQYGSPLDAINALKDQINRNPDNPRLYAALGNTFNKAALQQEQNKQHDLAVKTLQDALMVLQQAQQKWPDEASIYMALCGAEETANLLPDAEKTLLTWASRDAWKLRPEPYRRLAQFYDLHGAHDSAESALRTALARSNYRIDLQTDMAQMLVEHKKFDDAIAVLRSTNTDQPLVRQALVQTLVNAGRFDDAVAQLNTDLTGNPPDASNLLALWAGILLDRKDYAGTVDRATAALAIDSGNYRALHLRGRARLLTSPPDAPGALTDLAAARDAAPDDLQIRLDLGSAYLANNRTGDAIVELKSGLKSNPENKQLRMLLVNVYLNGAQPDFNAALSLLQEVDAAPPYSNDPQVLELEARILSHEQDMDGATQKIVQAASLAPGNVQLQREKFDQLLIDKQYQSVLDGTAALKLDPSQNWWISMFRGVASNGLGKKADAQAELGKAMQLAAATGNSVYVGQVTGRMARELGIPAAIAALTPLAQDHLQLQLSLVQLHHENNDDASAVAILDARMNSLDQLEKSDQIIFLENAALEYQSAQPQPYTDRAYDAMQKLLKLSPDDIGTLNNMAMLLADDYTPSRATEGMPYIQKAIDLLSQRGKEDPHLLDTEGWLLILSGSLQEGLDELNKSIELSQDATTYYHLGEGYLRLQNADEAVHQAQQGLALLNARTAPEPGDAQLKIQLQNVLTQGQAIAKSKPQDQTP